MKNLLYLTLFVFGCGPEIEVKPLNETPFCLYGIKKPYKDDNGNLKPREFIKCTPNFHPSEFPDWGYFEAKKVKDCSEC